MSTSSARLPVAALPQSSPARPACSCRCRCCSRSPATAVLLLCGLVMLVAGLARGQASVLVPIAQLSFVVTAGLGFFCLRETLTLRKGLGLAFAIAALVCLMRG